MGFNREELAPGIWAYYDVMENPQNFINDIEGLVEIKQLVWQLGTIGNVGDTSTGSYKVNTDIRVVETIGLQSFDRNPSLRNSNFGAGIQVHDLLNEKLQPTILDYATSHGCQPYATGESWQILKYGKGHHFENHVDDNKNMPRTFSISYYLNDDYEGGEIEFPRFGLKIKPKANMAILFAANYVYNHKIYPVTDGLRYTVVNWFE
jgi:hypothetical protein